MIENQDRDIAIFNFLKEKNVTIKELFYNTSQLPKLIGYNKNIISEAITLLVNTHKLNEDNILYLGNDRYSANVKASYNILEIFKIKRVCEYLKLFKTRSKIERDDYTTVYNEQYNWVLNNISDNSDLANNPEDKYFN